MVSTFLRLHKSIHRIRFSATYFRSLHLVYSVVTQYNTAALNFQNALLPFLGELCGEVGGDERCDDALDIVSSAAFLCRSKLPSSDKERIFFNACGELMPYRKDRYENKEAMCRVGGMGWMGECNELHQLADKCRKICHYRTS